MKKMTAIVGLVEVCTLVRAFYSETVGQAPS